MSAVVLLIILGSYPDTPDIYIATSNNRESRIIQMWYDKSLRDLCNFTPSQECGIYISDLDNIRSAIVDKTTIIHQYNPEKRKQYIVPTMPKYPQFRLGRYGKWQEFPDLAFIHPTYSIKYLDYVLRDYTYESDIEEWYDLVYRAELEVFLAYEIKAALNGEHFISSWDYEDAYIFTYEELMLYVRECMKKDGSLPKAPVAAKPPMPVLKNPLDSLNPN